VAVNRVYAAYRAGALAARALPGAALTPTARVLGAAAGWGLKDRRLMVERNLRRVSGEELTSRALRRAVNQTFESYTRYWLESFRLPGTAAADLDRGMSTTRFDHVTDGLAAGKGVILALPHLGGWEWAAFWLTEVLHLPVAAVVEPIQPPELAEWFVDLRRALGMEIITLSPSAGSDVVRALKANRIVCLLCDRDIGGGGVDVEFFGERTTLPGGPATLALRTGAPLLPAAVYYEGASHNGFVRPPLPAERTGRLRDDVARLTQALAVELEGLIGRAPEQWHLMQPNWPSDLIDDPTVATGAP
jgi:phosphatidylinositol dimannoside acyltransferase